MHLAFRNSNLNMDKKITIFYSWQSDLPKETNLNGIRQALRISANDVENSIDNISVDGLSNKFGTNFKRIYSYLKF